MVDKFRNDFFEKIINEEKEKEKNIKLEQKKCNHHYIPYIIKNKYQSRICSKCNHFAIKNIKVWNGTQNCVIA